MISPFKQSIDFEIPSDDQCEVLYLFQDRLTLAQRLFYRIEVQNEANPKEKVSPFEVENKSLNAGSMKMESLLFLTPLTSQIQFQEPKKEGTQIGKKRRKRCASSPIEAVKPRKTVKEKKKSKKSQRKSVKKEPETIMEEQFTEAQIALLQRKSMKQAIISPLYTCFSIQRSIEIERKKRALLQRQTSKFEQIQDTPIIPSPKLKMNLELRRLLY